VSGPHVKLCDERGCHQRATHGGSVEGAAWTLCDEHYLTRLVDGNLPAAACDFCSFKDVSGGTAYGCKDFVAGSTSGSLGAWLACRTCAQLIERGRWSTLARRSANRYALRHPGTDVRVVQAGIRHLHDKFRHYRTDEKRPIP
jgi:hypothetical protein